MPSRRAIARALLQLVVDKTPTYWMQTAPPFCCWIGAGELWSRVAEDLEIDEIRFPMHLGLEGCVASTGNHQRPERLRGPWCAYLEIDRLTGSCAASSVRPLKMVMAPSSAFWRLSTRRTAILRRKMKSISPSAAQVAAALKNGAVRRNLRAEELREHPSQHGYGDIR